MDSSISIKEIEFVIKNLPKSKLPTQIDSNLCSCKTLRKKKDYRTVTLININTKMFKKTLANQIQQF